MFYPENGCQKTPQVAIGNFIPNLGLYFKEEERRFFEAA
jgi:hypothetical protein